jgi:hypothetical protein
MLERMSPGAVAADSRELLLEGLERHNKTSSAHGRHQRPLIRG